MTEFPEPMGITRLSRAVGLSGMFFIKMPAHNDAEIARERLATGLGTIERIA